MRTAFLATAACLLGCASSTPWPVGPCDQNCPEVPMRDHWRRLGFAAVCAWEVEYQVGRKSPHKGCLLEFWHAKKNVPVERLRKWGWWNRGNRPPEKCEGYVFPGAGEVERWRRS